MELNAQLNFILLGKKGAGKSASGNTIMGRQAFISKRSSSFVTQDIAVESGTVDEFPVTVYDTPGFFDPEMSDEEIQQKLEKALHRCESSPCVFLLVIKADSFTEEERKTVVKIEMLLGEKRLKNTWILFTRGDELEDENTTIQEFLDRNKGLEKLVQKYDQRFCVFNNKKKGPSDQARMLLTKSIQKHWEVKDGGRLSRQIPDIRNSASVELDNPVSSLSSRRIVLLGKTGAGKSAAGNTILGQKEFKSSLSSNSVTSKCSEKDATVSGRNVTVVDTPGFFDTKIQSEELAKEIARSVYISSPGPHAFLIVLRVDDRFTEHEQQIPQKIEMVFGEGVLKYSIILFTRGDMLEEDPIEKIIRENCALRHLVQQCGGRFHIFNNKDQNDREQVNILLQMIDTMIEQNGGGHYSNQLYEDAQRFRLEEEERRQREEEKRKQQEKQKQDEIERLRKEIENIRTECENYQITQWEKQTQEEIKSMVKEKEKEIKALEELNLEQFDLQSDFEFQQFFKQYEEKFNFSAFTFGGYSGAALGGMYGAALGVIGGPVGVVVGGALGAAFGAAFGAVAGALTDVFCDE